MANVLTYTKVLTAADTNIIAETQTPLAAGDLTLAAGAASLDTQRRVLFTFAGNEAARTFVVYGTNQTGNAISESVTGTASTAVTLQDYKSVTRISVDAATAGALIVGTNGVGSTPWFNVNYQINPVNLSIAVDVTGTVNYTIEYTYDKFWGGYVPNQGWVDGTVTKVWTDPVLASETADGETTINLPITGWRATINSGTDLIRIQGIQAGIV